MAHLCALRHNHCEILDESRNLPDGSSNEPIAIEEKTTTTQMDKDKYTKQFSDLSTDSASEEMEDEVNVGAEMSPGEGLGRRLAIF